MSHGAEHTNRVQCAVCSVIGHRLQGNRPRRTRLKATGHTNEGLFSAEGLCTRIMSSHTSRSLVIDFELVTGLETWGLGRRTCLEFGLSDDGVQGLGFIN